MQLTHDALPHGVGSRRLTVRDKALRWWRFEALEPSDNFGGVSMR